MNHIAKKSFVVFAFLLVACNGQKRATAKEGGAEQQTDFELLVSDSYSGAENSETMVITSTKALVSFFAQINKTRKPGLPVPDIDFEKEMIIVTCSGPRNDGSLPVLKIKEETTSEMVLLSALKSSEDAQFQGLTSPFSLYKMPLTDKEIVFEAAQ
ncbi:hypothetical protein [Maribacter sp. 2307UL18-2]|uniref:hypothetical protein n=1 Tax=Maribacter sp. 2307UL18-2 TaxID=3386274 RepID=UPI0039BC7655